MIPVSDVVLFTLVAVGGALALRFWSLRRSERERARLVEPGLLAQFARLPANEITWVRIGFLGLGVAALALASGSATIR